MRRFVSTLLVSGLSLSLAACSSVPSQDRLVSGIDKTQLTQNTKTQRTLADPVCVDFYANIDEYKKEALASQGKRNFFNSLGLSVASAMVLGQVAPASGISNQAGRIAVGSATGAVTAQGKQMALKELNSSDRVDAKIIKVADDLGCPVKVVP